MEKGLLFKFWLSGRIQNVLSIAVPFYSINFAKKNNTSNRRYKLATVAESEMRGWVIADLFRIGTLTFGLMLSIGIFNLPLHPTAEAIGMTYALVGGFLRKASISALAESITGIQNY